MSPGVRAALAGQSPFFQLEVEKVKMTWMNESHQTFFQLIEASQTVKFLFGGINKVLLLEATTERF